MPGDLDDDLRHAGVVPQRGVAVPEAVRVQVARQRELLPGAADLVLQGLRPVGLPALAQAEEQQRQGAPRSLWGPRAG